MRNDPLLATMAGDHRFDNQVPKASSADEQMDASRRSAAGVHPRRSAGAREPVGALPVLEQQIDGFIRAESFALTGLKEQD